MKKIGTYIALGILYTLSVLPMWVLHRLADVLYFFLYYVFGYRKKVVQTNLEKSFPEKSPQEIKAIAKASYKHLADLIVESLKGFTISEKEMRRRFTTTNINLLDKYHNQNRNIIIVTAHYNSWEWAGMSMGLHINFKNFGMYKPVSDKVMEKALLKSRQKFGLEMYPMKDTAAYFERYKNQYTLTAFVADQTPSNIDMAYWTTFLNQDTPFFRGPERHAIPSNSVIFYVNIQKLGRSRYNANFELMFEEPTQTKENEITEAYVRRLESVLRENPNYWLWTHKRWKKSRV